MNLRNGKIIAVNNVATPKELECTCIEERTKEFVDEINSALHWALQFEDTSYARVCAYCELFDLVLDRIDEFKYLSPELEWLFDSIRESALRMLAQLGKLAIKHGKDREYMRAANRLTKVLMAVLAKYAEYS